uniref:Uncharacterized protein n=1 Tax=Pelusios castaneus TaxID=367368 RepID=A0A8C8RTB7_9SAUR
MDPQAGMQILETYFDRRVEIEIFNRTKDVTLHSPRSYCFSGHSLLPPSPKILPGSNATCLFAKGRFSFRGSVGLLVYNSDAFTLAIMFSNPFDYILYHVKFAVEISPDKDHLGNLKEIYENMCNNNTPTNICSSLKKVKLDKYQETLVVTSRNIHVMATMSNAANAVIKVIVEDKGNPPANSNNPTY